MPIKMRHNNKEDAMCCECGAGQNDSIDMFDICIGGDIHTLCDLCNEQVLNKTLHAECYKNGRVKSSKDMRVKRIRKEKGLT